MSPDSAHGSGQVARSQDASDTLTTRQGHPVVDSQNMRTVGSRGPATLENYQFIEKITHFDCECIPERVVHARVAAGIGIDVTDLAGAVGSD